MHSSDPYVVFLVQVALVLFLIFAALRDMHIRKLERTAEASAEVTRSEKSMHALYTVYAGAMASCLVLLDKAAGIDGHKVALIVLDFICITYIFFFSTWFRNAVFFPLAQRVRKD